MRPIYFDYASTTPTDPQVIEAMGPYFFEKFGNPSSSHSLGRGALKALEEARETLAEHIGARAEEIVFTSGATEANNQAVLGTARLLKKNGNHILLSSIEHHSVHEPVERLRKEGFRISTIPVGPDGMVDPQKVKDLVTDQTILVAVMHASNEIGTIQPISEISKVTKEHNVPFLVDAVQAVGHIPVDVDDLGADLLSLSAHKFYGPKGVGALFIRKGFDLPSLLLGGDQERSRRASTQNVAGAVGLAKAIEICSRFMEKERETQVRLREQLLEKVPQIVEGAKINGHRERRLPNNAHFSFEGIEGESLLMSLDMIGIAASMGSACTSGAMEPSHTLRAIGLSDELAYGSLRLTLGRWSTQGDIDLILEQLPQALGSLRV